VVGTADINDIESIINSKFMKNNYLHLCDKNYDSEFDNINLLLRYPWVGINYKNSDYHVLLLGDSHYASNEDGTHSTEEEKKIQHG
jgi:hypothetical protein